MLFYFNKEAEQEIPTPCLLLEITCDFAGLLALPAMQSYPTNRYDSLVAALKVN